MKKFKNLKELVNSVKDITKKFDPANELPVFEQFVKTFSQLRPDQVTEQNKIRDPKIVKYNHRYANAAEEMGKLLKKGIFVTEYEELLKIENDLIAELKAKENKTNEDHDLLIKAVLFVKQLEGEYDQTISSIVQTGNSLMELDSRVTVLAKKFAAKDNEQIA